MSARRCDTCNSVHGWQARDGKPPRCTECRNAEVGGEPAKSHEARRAAALLAAKAALEISVDNLASAGFEPRADGDVRGLRYAASQLRAALRQIDEAMR